MGDEDIIITATAEKVADLNAWNQDVTFHGTCMLGCTGRKMLGTKNILVALRWESYHREGEEHQKRLEARSNGAGTDRHEHAVEPEAHRAVDAG